VVAALAGRHGRPTATRRRLATGPTVTAVAGLALAGLVAWRWAAERRAGGGGTLLFPLALLAGFGLTMVSLTVLAPALVGLAGRLGGRLALTGRLALRDAARQRHRTGPAVGAVMVAVAGSVAVAFAVASYDTRDRDAYRAALPDGWASVLLNVGAGGYPGFGSEADQLAAIRSAAAELPTTGMVPVSTAEPPSTDRYAQVLPDTADCGSYNGTVGAGARTARLVAGPGADAAVAALAAGRAVVTEPCLIHDGTVRVLVSGVPTGSEQPKETTYRLPAVLVPGRAYDGLPQTVLPEPAARRIGLVPRTYQVVLPTTRTPTAAEEDRARTALGPLAQTLQVERGYGAPYLPGFVALMGGAGLVTLAGVAISVALSAAEGRADLATLAAIGAPPRRRRGLAMVQAALVAGLGVGLGLLLGAAIGLTIMSGLDGYPVVVPWLTVLVVGAGVPLLGVAAVGVLTRSRLPMVRRIG
jgi:putative ABC transport system permease protein